MTEQRGKAKLDVRFADGSRRTAVLPMPWLPAQARSIQEAIEEIARRVAAGRPFPDAVAAVVGLPSVAPLPPAAGGDKEALLRAWGAFGDFKVNRSGQVKASTWERDYGTSGRRLRAVASAADVRELLKRAGEIWQPGGRQRQITLQHISAMLRWAVAEELLPADRWMPPTDLRPYVGENTKTADPAVPLTDQHILDLLDGLPTDPPGKRWRYVIQLLAAYGLRPVEVMHLRLTPTGQLWCDYRKRGGGGSTKPRQLRALHPEWEREWRLLERLAAGESMPPFGGGVANAARRYLARQPVWQPLVAIGATTYGFRHGYALRAHQSYGLSPRVAAALMGHSPETHQRHYGSWTDEATIDAALEAGVRYRNLTQAAINR